ncbi:hypothetical protein ACFVUS_03340 [Nocardia sp. NPDC058058]|uniref:hypothetical protein n=1 Tax=Nocardia sp. NPDC058058 TaxID=3346317 RepID=UPI0036DB5DB9
MDRNAFVEVMNEASGMLESGRAPEALARLTAFDNALLSPPDPKDYGWVVSYTFRSAFAAGEYDQALRIAENGPARFPADIPPATLATMYSMGVEAATQLGRADSAVLMADRCIDLRRSHGDHGEVLMAAMTACTLLGDIERHDLASRYAQLLVAEGDGYDEYRAYGYYAICAAIEHEVGGHLIDTLRAGRDWLLAHDNEFAREALGYLNSSAAIENGAPTPQAPDLPLGPDPFAAQPGPDPLGPPRLGADPLTGPLPGSDPLTGPLPGSGPLSGPPPGSDPLGQPLPGSGPLGSPSLGSDPLGQSPLGPGSPVPGPFGPPPVDPDFLAPPPFGAEPFDAPPPVDLSAPLGPPLGGAAQTELLNISADGMESVTGPKQPPADQLAGGETADALLEAQRPGIAAAAYRALIDDAIATGKPDPLIAGKAVLGLLMALIFDNRVGEAHAVWIDEQGPTYLGVWALENGQTSVHDAMAYNLVAAFLHSLSTGDPNAANHAVDTLMGRCVNWAFGTDPQVVPAMLNTWRRHLFEIHEGEPAPEYVWELGQAEQRWGGPLPESGLYWMRPYPWVVDWL